MLKVHVFNLYLPLPVTHWQLLVLHLQMDTQSIIYITIYKWIHNRYVCPGYDIKLHLRPCRCAVLGKGQAHC